MANAVFLTATESLSGTGGGVTYTRSILRVLRHLDFEGFACVEVLPPWQKMPSPLRRVRALARGLLSDWPAKTHFLVGLDGIRTIRASLSGDADLVFVNGADLWPLARMFPRCTHKVLVAHNLERLIMQQRAGKSRQVPLLGWIMDREVDKIEAIEAEAARDCPVVITASAVDGQWFRGASDGVFVCQVPCPFDGEPYRGPRPLVTRPLRVGFLGKATWQPNRQAIDWLVSNLAPALEPGRVEIHLFGPGTEAFAGTHPLVHAHGFVAQLSAVWNDVHMTVCPTLSGSGLNIKLVESLWNGVPVLASPRACAALPPLAQPGVMALELHKWADFLNSWASDQFASVPVGQEIVDFFSLDPHVRALRAVLRSVGIDA